MLVLASISETVVDHIATWIRDGGLPAIFALMAVSSACIPIPSEVVMLFAGFAVADPSLSGAHHDLTMLGVVTAGVLGCLVGSWVAYGVGRAGRLELMQRHGAKVHMGPEQIERADRFFQRYGGATVFWARMVPFVRAFVSLPAGVARMPLIRFSVLTVLGSVPWVLAFALAGKAAGGDWTQIKSAFQYVDYFVIAAVIAVIVYMPLRHRRASRAGDRPGALPGALPGPGGPDALAGGDSVADVADVAG